MPNIYTSKNVENGLTFDDLITKLLAYKPDQWGYTEQDFNNIKTDFNVSENSLYNLPLGNYKLKNMPNSPFNSEFVNVKILMDGTNKLLICDIGGMEIFGTGLTEANPNGSDWEDITTRRCRNTGGEMIIVSNTAPTVGAIWIDTSKAYTTGEIFLRIRKGDGWTSYTVTDSMDMSVYDKNGLKKDPYKEVMNEVEKFIGDYTEIIMHINNELKLIHIDASDREYFDTYLLTSENVAKYFEEGGEFYNEMVEYVKSTITTTTGLDTTTLSTNFDTLKESLKDHYDNHITEEDVVNWDSKADAGHTHNLDPNVTVDASDIDFGDSTIPDAAIPDSVKERPVLITSLSVLRNIDTSLLESTYHNGNMLYLVNDNDGYDFYKIVDNSYFNTDDYMEGVKKFSVEIGEVNFADAIKVPNNGYTLADYGITDALSTSDLENLSNSYEDELKCEIVPSNLTAEAVGDADLYVKVNQSYDDTIINVYASIDSEKDKTGDVYDFKYEKKEMLSNKGSLPLKRNWQSICYGNDKFVAVPYNASEFAYSLDGITWTAGSLPSGGYWNSICYGNDKFIIVKTNSNNNINFAYSSDGITWTGSEITLVGYSTGLVSVCYGKDKFVAVGYYSSSTDFAYSSDGITWTAGTLPIYNQWEFICYGKDKFIAVGNSNIYVYSSDGITWSQGDLPSISSHWYSVCYGNDKFIALSTSQSTGSDIYAYSSDGITWSQGKFYGAAQWSYICYGDNKFVIICNASNIVLYSSDGINWTKGLLPSVAVSQNRWSSICYGKDKFVSIGGNVSSTTDVFVHITFVLACAINGDCYQYRISNVSTNYYFSSTKPVDTTIVSNICNKTYTDWNGNKFHIKIYWDPERGLVFASPNMVSKLITADYINKNELTASAADAIAARFITIRDKLN